MEDLDWIRDNPILYNRGCSEYNEANKLEKIRQDKAQEFGIYLVAYIHIIYYVTVNCAFLFGVRGLGGVAVIVLASNL